LFEDQARRHPGSVAAICNGRRLTYAELNTRANQLAHRLRQLGAGPDRLVVLYLERSLEMLVAMLAVLKSGSAYVPLDPGYPAERLSFVIQDSAASLAITQGDAPLLRRDGLRVIDLDAEAKSLGAEPPADLRIEADPGRLAYVIYTSGSTGTPKGVAIEHRSVVNFLDWFGDELEIQAGETVLAVTSISFDISVLELFLPLVHGGTTWIVPRDRSADGMLLAGEISASGATIIQATPATWRLLTDTGWAHGAGLKLLCGGEALSETLAQALCKTGAAIWNVYGPTETTVWSTAQRLRLDDQCVSIGLPIGNTEAYVLDTDRELVPIGGRGELYLGGDGLARGYWNRPDLTQDRFVPHPLAARAGSRLYRTGDLVRRFADGRLEYLGRLDRQLKLRGHRIEPGEIEAVLARCTGVRQALVAVREWAAGDERLVAYLVTDAGAPLDLAPLRHALRGAVPGYMLPSDFVFLAELPLTPAGKVDVRALPHPRLERESDPGAHVGPRTPAEEKLAVIWGRVLKREPISINASFFDLGGHSLLAVELFRQIEREFGRRLPLLTLFQAPSVAALAEELISGEDRPVPALVTVQEGGALPTFYCVHGIGGGVLCYYDLARYLGPERPFRAFQAEHFDEADFDERSVEKVAARYVAELLEAQPEGPYLLGGLSYGGLVAFEMAQQLQAQGRQVELLALFDTVCVGHALQFSLGARLRHHVQVLLRGKAENSGAYLREKAAGLSVRLKRRLWQAVHHATNRVSLPMPAALRERGVADYVAQHAYQPRPYPGAVALFRARDTLRPAADRCLGWDQVALAGVTVYDVPGNHTALVYEPHVRVLADHLRGALDRAVNPE
jgi:amino acid adenylation domain-containing protein